MTSRDFDEWKGCYPSNWRGKIIESKGNHHPAKFSSRLIRRIYEHVIEEHWAQIGSRVIDPFAGVATGALDAMRFGLQWRGVELEAKWCESGRANIDLWNNQYKGIGSWSGDAQLINGDSRELLKTLELFALSISSPPYLQQRGGMGAPKGLEEKYPGIMERHAAGNRAAGGYGISPGQIERMPEGSFELSMSSPPYLPDPERRVRWGAKSNQTLEECDESRGYRAFKGFRGAYSLDPRNIGNPTGADQSTFWQACRQVVEQVYRCLEPGGHAIWVTKDFVRKKQIAPFTEQWRELCEAVGFKTLHEHRATVIIGKQHTLEGDVLIHESKSYFRRVVEKKGTPRIDWETVWCMVKPMEGG